MRCKSMHFLNNLFILPLGQNLIIMRLLPVDVVSNINAEDFKQKYFNPQIPVVIKNLSKEWPAYNKWNWDYFKAAVGDKKVGIYNNVKSDAYTPINKAD